MEATILHLKDGATPVDSSNPLPVTLASGSVDQEVVGNAASDAADSGNPVKIGAVYNLSKPTVQDGDRVDSQADPNGNLYVRESYAPDYEDNTNDVAAVAFRKVASSSYSPTSSGDYGSAVTAVEKASAGNVYGFIVHNDNASARYFQLHNVASSLSGGEAPFEGHTYLVPANSERAEGPALLGESGIHLDTGVCWAISTTRDTYTAATASDHTTNIMYM